MSTIHRVALGSQGLEVPAQGLGCMGMSPINGAAIYGPADEAESIATIHRARELGVNLLDTADLYSPLLNEQLVGRAVAGRRPEYILATKFGFEVDEQKQEWTGRLNGHPAYMRQCIERSLRNLGTDYIDLYYLHRIDPQVPVEETVGAMSRLVEEGKVRYLGLSEAPADALRRAHQVHPITALQTEYSLFDRTVEEAGTLAAARELGIGFVAYSPLGRGFLTGQIQRFEDLAEDDYRRFTPRFQGENFQKNLDLVARIKELAQQKGCTPGQLALAWVLAQGRDIVPIPGTKRVPYLEENVGALHVQLTPDDLRRIDEIAPQGAAAGPRYPAEMMQAVNR